MVGVTKMPSLISAAGRRDKQLAFINTCRAVASHGSSCYGGGHQDAPGSVLDSLAALESLAAPTHAPPPCQPQGQLRHGLHPKYSVNSLAASVHTASHCDQAADQLDSAASQSKHTHWLRRSTLCSITN